MDKSLAIRMQEDSNEERNILYSTVSQLSAEEIQETYNGWITNHKRGKNMYKTAATDSARGSPPPRPPPPPPPPPRPPPPLWRPKERKAGESTESAPNAQERNKADSGSRTTVLQEMLRAPAPPPLKKRPISLSVPIHYIGPARSSAEKEKTLEEIVRRRKEIRDALDMPPHKKFVTDRTSGGSIYEELSRNRPELQITLMGEGKSEDIDMTGNEKNM